MSDINLKVWHRQAAVCLLVVKLMWFCWMVLYRWWEPPQLERVSPLHQRPKPLPFPMRTLKGSWRPWEWIETFCTLHLCSQSQSKGLILKYTHTWLEWLCIQRVTLLATKSLNMFRCTLIFHCHSEYSEFRHGTCWLYLRFWSIKMLLNLWQFPTPVMISSVYCTQSMLC